MKVLIAEDNVTNRRLLEVTLSSWGYEVVLAANGAEAWEALQGTDPPQLVILDWMMPRMDGLEICRRLRESPVPRMTYIILLTARGQKTDIITGLQAGADDYVTKPFDREELKARVEAGGRVILLQQALADRRQELAVARALITERERFDAAISAMSDGIVTTGEDWRIVTANDAACRLLNLAQQSQTGTPLQEALALFELSVSWEELCSIQDRTVAFEIARPHTSPPLFMDARLTRVLDATGELHSSVLTVRDVTSQRHAQHVRADFFMMLPHKLRTPLTVLGGYLDLCRRLPPERLREDHQEILGVCQEELRRLEEIVQKLLEFKDLTTRQIETEAERTEVAEVVESAIAELRRAHPSKTEEIATAIAPEASHVAANAENVRLVLGKLLDNAVKFADKDKVVVRVEVQRKDSDWLEFSITDNGPGIPHEYFERVFQGFVQVEDRVTGRVPGVGLGLFMARQVVVAYGGRISIQSQIGEGTTLTFTLPATPEGW
ncbi:MAG: response regulator [Armatimonadetes bacterium]|nr:response regulator [Armatimonadota bacterium]